MRTRSRPNHESLKATNRFVSRGWSTWSKSGEASEKELSQADQSFCFYWNPRVRKKNIPIRVSFLIETHGWGKIEYQLRRRSRPIEIHLNLSMLKPRIEIYLTVQSWTRSRSIKITCFTTTHRKCLTEVSTFVLISTHGVFAKFLVVRCMARIHPAVNYEVKFIS